MVLQKLKADAISYLGGLLHRLLSQSRLFHDSQRQATKTRESLAWKYVYQRTTAAARMALMESTRRSWSTTRRRHI